VAEKEFPLLNRPYKVPLGIPGLVCGGLVPVVFLIYIMTLAKPIVYILASSLAPFLMIACTKKNWIEFSVRRESETGRRQNSTAENRMDAGEEMQIRGSEPSNGPNLPSS